MACILILCLILCPACQSTAEEPAAAPSKPVLHDGDSDALYKEIDYSLGMYARDYNIPYELSVSESGSENDPEHPLTFNVEISAPNLSEWAIAYQAHFARDVFVGLPARIALEWTGYSSATVPVEITLTGDLGPYEFADTDSAISLSCGGSSLIVNETWDTIDAEYLDSVNGPLSYEQWFEQKAPELNKPNGDSVYWLELPLTGSEDLMYDDEFMSVLYSYAKDNLSWRNANYFTISFADGMAIEFFGCDYLNAQYGTFQKSDYSVGYAVGYLLPDETTYIYNVFLD